MMGAAVGVDLWAYAHRMAMVERMRVARAQGDAARSFDIALALLKPALVKALHG